MNRGVYEAKQANWRALWVFAAGATCASIGTKIGCMAYSKFQYGHLAVPLEYEVVSSAITLTFAAL